MLFTARPQLDSYGYDRKHEKVLVVIVAYLLHIECEDIIATVNHQVKFIVKQHTEIIFILILWKVH